MPSDSRDDWGVSKKPSKTLQVLSENLVRLMASSVEFSSDGRVAAKAKIDQKTIWRIVHRQNEPSIDKVEKIAGVFGLQAWQLLVPDMEPTHPPEVAVHEEA